MMDSNPPVTWIEFGILTTICLTLGGLLFAWVRSTLNAQGRAITKLSEKIDANNLEVARHYATMDMVSQVETRLTNTINAMSQQMSGALNSVASRVEALFGQLLEVVREQRHDRDA